VLQLAALLPPPPPPLLLQVVGLGVAPLQPQAMAAVALRPLLLLLLLVLVHAAAASASDAARTEVQPPRRRTKNGIILNAVSFGACVNGDRGFQQAV
jgi:hypothetical protein